MWCQLIGCIFWHESDGPLELTGFNWPKLIVWKQRAFDTGTEHKYDIHCISMVYNDNFLEFPRKDGRGEGIRTLDTL